MGCHGADAKGGSVYGTMVGGMGSFTTNARVRGPIKAAIRSASEDGRFARREQCLSSHTK